MQPSSYSYLDEARDKVWQTLKYVLLFSFVVNVLMLALPLYSLQILDRVMSSGSLSTLIMLTLVVGGAFVFWGLFTALRGLILQRIGEWLEEVLAPKVLASTITKAASITEIGGTQNLRDLNTIKGFISGTGIISLCDAPWAPLYFLIIFLVNPVVGMIALIGGFLMLGLAFMTEISTKKPLDDANHHHLRNMRFADTANRNAEVVESMGMMRAVVNYWQRQNHEVQRHQGVASNRGVMISSLSKVLRMFIQIAVVGTGGYLAMSHHITVGGMIAGSMLSGRALAPFDAAIGIWKNVVATRDSYHRLTESLRKATQPRSTMNMPVPKGRLVGENVFFRPPGADRLVLRGVKFVVEPGESLGIIGPSAAGKSTLAKLIVGIWPPTQGAIRLDGVDVYKWDREDFGKYVGYLPQDVDLFPGTIKQNIARLNDDAQDAEIVEAARFAGVHELILKLPKGYDTQVGEGLVSLSPGQKQRIGLARALFRRPRMLVLDEPNSNLDGEGEMALTAAIKATKKLGITTVMVAHKPSLVANLDKILMLRNGGVEAFGTRQEVLGQYVKSGAGERPASSDKDGAPKTVKRPPVQAIPPQATAQAASQPDPEAGE